MRTHVHDIVQHQLIHFIQVADADIAWKIMLNKRTELQEWVNKVIEKGELYASPTSAELEELAAQEILELTGLHALS